MMLIVVADGQIPPSPLGTETRASGQEEESENVDVVQLYRCTLFSKPKRESRPCEQRCDVG
eukprot:5181853-Prymnesium_polylepis.3